MTEAYIGLGANLNSRLANLAKARQMLQQTPKVAVVRTSLIYETAPVGDVAQGDYLNQVVVVDTQLTPLGLLARLHEIEAALHRQRIVRWGPRTVDLDLLYYGQVHQATAELHLPHPQIPKRRFVLVPLLEVAQGPLAAQVAAMLQATTDHSAVRLYIANKR
ncbi:2-amino-4-hydroxy-6-hydroxymethyldihydropteridine diphosphokinase [Lacticaseibacillus jixiensis]|uniref:2-amino-4-hydroxy-6- hydroxymethyldihydropteridine diphosphokinase n=1 Tax=Lacticaseibacillus jixiensis TaxID=3231926 RepID=UPI0036F2B5DB